MNERRLAIIIKIVNVNVNYDVAGVFIIVHSMSPRESYGEKIIL